MAEWKKVVVSGSGVAQLSNDANYLIDAQDGAQLSGSFTGSFVGDGSGLTGVTADGTISGSVQVTVQDTTGFSGLQANISSSITSLSASVDTHLDANISALSASVDTHLDANISALSASAHADRVNKISVLSASVDTHLDSNISSLSSSAEVKREAISSSFATTGAAQDSRLTAIEAFTGSLDDTFATEAELHTATASLSASAHTDRIAKIAILSASVDAHLDANITALSSSVDTHLDANITALSASAHSQRISEDTVLSGSAHTDRVAKVAVLSGSAHTDRIAKVAVLSGSAHTARRSEISDLSGSAHTDRVAKVAALSASSAAALATQGSDVTDLAASQSAFDTAFTLSGQNVTVAGNLEVSGTTTTVDSTTVEFADNIISLNGTGAANGGIEVNDTNGPASGSLVWDGSANQWIAGGKGSETAVFTAGGDHSLVSGSVQVTISDTTGYTAYSASVQTYTDAVVAALSASADTHLDANISALSASVDTHLDANISALSASVDTHLDANITALSSSADSQRNAISGALAATIGNLSSSTLTSGSFDVSVSSGNGELLFTEGQIIGDKYNQGNGTLDIFAPSGAAHVELNYGDQDFIYLDGRKAGIQLETDGATIEWTFYGTNGQLDAPGNITVPAGSSVSGGAGNFTTLTGSLNYDQLVSVPGGIISSSAQTVAALDNQHTDFGTGAITASGYSGDGSGLVNLTVTQNATIDDSFTNVTSYTVNHNFGSKNVIVQVYDTSDEMIIPASVDTSNPNTAVIDFGDTFSGRAVVARGGHIVSGSIPFANLLEVPTLISGSGQVQINNTDGYVAYSQSVQTYTDAVVAALSASADTHLDANIAALSASVDAHLDANITALSASVDTHLDANITALSASAHTARGTIDSSFTLSADSGTNDTFTTGNTLTFAGTANEIETTVSNDQIQIGLPNNVTIGGALTVTGDLTVTGNTTEQQVTNLNVEDQFILINSGGVAQDAGFVVNGQGAAFGWDESENRFALDFSGATWDQTAITSDAYVAAVVTTDDVNYQKIGNIRIDSDDIYIYV